MRYTGVRDKSSANTPALPIIDVTGRIIMTSRFSLVAIAVLGFSIVGLISKPSHAATLDLVSGQLVGASGVSFDGSLYNVEFVDGSCFALFDRCDEASDFVFQSSQIAQNALGILLDQVFLDSVAGAFDSNPALTNGCEDADSCRIVTPFKALGNDVLLAGLTNTADGPGQTDAVFPGVFIRSRASGPIPDSSETFAVWSSVSAVPVPAAIWLFGTALIGLVGFGKRRKVA
jgi:hypothetical protein